MEFNYVVGCAGSASCVLTNRLSAKNEVSVALIEAGGANNSSKTHIPVGCFITMDNPKTDWCYKIKADVCLRKYFLGENRG